MFSFIRDCKLFFQRVVPFLSPPCDMKRFDLLSNLAAAPGIYQLLLIMFIYFYFGLL